MVSKMHNKGTILSGIATLTHNNVSSHATYKICGQIGFLYGCFTCKNASSEDIKVSELPTGYRVAYGGCVIRDSSNGNLHTAWCDNNSNVISTFGHSGTMTVGHDYYFVVPIIMY